MFGTIPCMKHHDWQSPAVAEFRDSQADAGGLPSELAAVEFLERARWGDPPCCVRCGSVDVFKLRDRKSGERNKRFLWKCRDCKRQYANLTTASGRCSRSDPPEASG